MTGPARVLNLLHAAHPDDVPRVLNLMTDAELDAGLASELCDPVLRAADRDGPRPDRQALCRALLAPRPALVALLQEPGRAPEAVCAASRALYQPMLPDGVTPFGRPQADLRRLIAGRINGALGDAWPLWHGVLTRIGAWEGSFADLIALATSWGPRPPASDLPIKHKAPTEIFPPGVLFGMAPPRVGEAILAYTGPRSQDLVESLLKLAPYHPAYLEHVLGPAGTSYHEGCLAQSRAMPLAAAHDFLTRSANPRVPRLLANAHDDLPLRLHAVRVIRADPRAQERAGTLETSVEQIHATLTAADTAESLIGYLAELRPILKRHPAGPRLRLLAYPRLARMAGPEAVWAVELEYCTRLEDMTPAVRASMETNSSAPLEQVAAGIEAPGRPPEPPLQVPPAHWPLEDAVHAHLDHRPERWRVLIELAGTDPAPVAGLVRAAGAELVGQRVRPAGRGVQDLNRTPPVPGPDHDEPAQEGD